MANSEEKKSGAKVKIQRFGSHLSGMIMPNIGAFIAWGIITALFIPTGWIPNEDLAKLVTPMITYLLPLLIGFSGGRIVYDLRGGVVGATATMGVIVGADIPMLLGAMIMGPLGGWAIKKFDKMIDGKVRSGFEMLVNNFSAGIIAGILTLVAYKGIGPVVLTLNKTLAAGVQAIVDAHLLPLASIFIEPAKVLFLNNAINHGILSPLGIEQAAKAGKSILFLLESNPGPGFGVLLAYILFGRGMAKQSAPGAAIIHFLGGIHEIYFPYILMKPMLLLSVIAGGASGVFTFLLFDAGLVAAPSPGSIFALIAMTPRGHYLGVLAGVLVATAVSFLISSIILKSSKKTDDDDDELTKAAEKTSALKGKESRASSLINKPEAKKEEPVAAKTRSDVNKIIFACDAGMGSSAMGASILKNKVQKAGLDIAVSNTSINNLPSDADIVITHKDLTDRAKAKLPGAEHISVENFLNSPKYDELMNELKEGQGAAPAEAVSEPAAEQAEDNEYTDVSKIIFACDAGMGSSAMGASILKNKVKKAGLDVAVSNTSISNLPDDADVVITHKDLTDRAKTKLPGAKHISVENFLNSPKYDELMSKLESAKK
ncbi:PTS mannitol-specific transporter subunit IIBC [Fictibacillus enclensis]|uniref:PTS mannitol-specific transporter subunit IIBC n=1 Tax=Fictibacillus enclensis TaxID=1017270 RepID=UPI0025A227D0|nr:PTS mannitol-specific transporter subunit IIBC [Fictibacillus enclensis]MDM5196951.1 PTS mannitol-specific transporter subunit IIBC [Fictibacillus enclensis]MDM5336079.1 PTS mannitol-specific transporter subunit IIBC [Fictibacillus enclensis]